MSQDEITGAKDRKVEITIDNKHFDVIARTYTIVELKTIGAVPLAYDLLEKVGGKLKPLPDDGKTHIEGKEVFFSQPKTGASS